MCMWIIVVLMKMMKMMKMMRRMATTTSNSNSNNSMLEHKLNSEYKLGINAWYLNEGYNGHARVQVVLELFVSYSE